MSKWCWRWPWGNRAYDTLLAEMLQARYLYCYPELLVAAELRRRKASEDQK